MKRSTVINIVMMLSLGILSGQVFAGEVNSLRGVNPLDNKAKEPAKLNIQDDREPIERDYVQQPPLIPHKIKGYKINVKFNKCLTCHSWANYKEAGATKISQTHFSDREENVLANIAARRYFCTQCHVPQVDAPPLVENTFDPLKTVKRH
jgi:cytochrome c-type protein NapB